ncbi:MAG TPA: YceI family protein [Chthoniobacter sp.]|nr:YceI family protein [Chthoniobacter sp.]
MNLRTSLLNLTAVAALLLSGRCFAGQNLPLDAKGSSLTFVGDATLHTFKGEAKEFSGSATVDADAIPPVQKASLRFKTASLTTFNDKRDQNMRNWLKIEVHPDVTFTLESVKLVEGDSKQADAQHPARFTVNGTLTLNGLKQPFGGAALGWRDKDRLIVSGDAVVDTSKFGLPQIKQAFLTVGTQVKTSYRFSFILPPGYAATK